MDLQRYANYIKCLFNNFNSLNKRLFEYTCIMKYRQHVGTGMKNRPPIGTGVKYRPPVGTGVE